MPVVPSTQIRVTVLDINNGNPVAGVDVRLESQPVGEDGDGDLAATNVDGVSLFTVSRATPGVVVYTASVLSGAVVVAISRNSSEFTWIP